MSGPISRAIVEHFSEGQDSIDVKALWVALINLAISVVIIALVGKMLWNSVVCKLISVTRPATSFQILGLAVLMWLLIPTPTCISFM